MLYRTLGRTGLNVSLLSLGSGGHDPFGQGRGIPESEIHRLIHRGLELGINLFDTAPAYLESELILGRALRSVPRDRYLISTKVALVKDAAGELATGDDIVATVEASLKRLQVDAIDLLLAGGFVSASGYQRIVQEQWPVLEQLKRDGKVRFLGATEKSSDDGAHDWLVRGLHDDLFDAVMVAYNLINQSADQAVFPLCKEKDVGTMIIYSVRNVFSDPVRLSEVIRDFKQRGLLEPGALPDDDPLAFLLGGDVPSIIEAAYRFAANHKAVSTVMTGTIDIAHLEENVETVQRPALPAEKLERLKQLFGHISEPVGN